MANILSFFRPIDRSSSRGGDWTPQEIAEFYRVEASLIRAGMSVVCDRGLTDEGEPWFVFCRSYDQEVVIHFARVDGFYWIVSEATGHSLRGPDFRRLLAEFASINPKLIPLQSRGGSKLMIHPAALLAAVVAAAYFHLSVGELVASEMESGNPRPADVPRQVASDDDRGAGLFDQQERQIFVAMAAMIGFASANFLLQNTDLIFSFQPETMDSVPVRQVSEVHVVSEGLDVSQPTGSDLSSHVATFMDWALSPLPPANVVGQDIKLSKSEVASSDPVEHGHAATVTQYRSIDENLIFSENVAVDPPLNVAALPGSKISIPIPEKVAAHGGEASQPLHMAMDIVTADLAAANLVANVVTLPPNLNLQVLIGVNLARLIDQGELVDFGSDSQFNELIQAALNPTSAASQTSAAFALVQNFALSPFDAHADAIVNAFVHENRFEILNSAGNIVLFDLDVSHYVNADFQIRSWVMPDGSTISVVGHVSQAGHIAV